MGVLHLLYCPRLLAVGAVTTIHGPHEPGQQQRSGYNGTSDITASAPPPASWRGRARASASGYKVLMTEAQEASYTAAASERVFPVRQLSLSSVFRLIVVTMPGLVQLSCILAAAAQVQAWGGVFNRYKETDTNWNTSPQRSTH